MSFRLAILLLVSLALGPALFADNELAQLCKLVLHEETNKREDLKLELDIARTEVQATEDVFSLVDELWKEEATELLRYLGNKRNRDFALVDERRAEVVLQRQDALLEEARLLCQIGASGESSAEQRKANAKAHDRYLSRDCERLALRIEMAEVELDYAERVRDAYIDLRQFAAAAAIDVMEWNYEVEVAHKKLEHAKRRTRSCRAALGLPPKKEGTGRPGGARSSDP
jgi:hypothetical protein